MSLEVEACQEVGADTGTSADAAADLAPLGDEALRLAGAVGPASKYPAATAITMVTRKRLDDLLTPTDLSNHEGRDVSATVEGRRVTMGRPGWLAGEISAEVPEAVHSTAEKAQDSGATAVALAVGESGEATNVEAKTPNEAAVDSTTGASNDTGTAAPDTQSLRAMAVLVMRDTMQPSSREAVAALRELRIRPVLLTEDNTRATEHVATQVGIDAVDMRAEVLPADERNVATDLQAQGTVIGMVDDGVNDAVALTQAGTQGLDFAMDSEANVAIEATDITLVRTDLDVAAAAMRVSRATLRIIRQNLFWVFAYNMATILLAAAELPNPMIAETTMTAPSVIVVTNSLRLRRAGWPVATVPVVETARRYGGADGGAPVMLAAMATLSPQARMMMVRTLGEGRVYMR